MIQSKLTCVRKLTVLEIPVELAKHVHSIANQMETKIKRNIT